MTRSSIALARPKNTSVKKQYDLLAMVVKAPESVPKSVRDLLLPALVSQGALAAFELPDAGIVGMALNTHKAIANEALSGRYEALNDYRKAALKKLKAMEHQAAQPGRGTINWYKSELEEKSAQLKRVADDIAHMSLQLDEILKLSRHMAREAGMEKEFNKRRAEILRKFGIS